MINGIRNSQETTALYIEPYTITPGSTSVVQVVTMLETNRLSQSTDRVALTCVPEPMIVSISGGSQRLVGYDETFVLDASDSTDPAAAPGTALTYAWTCVKDSGRGCGIDSDNRPAVWEIDARNLSPDSSYEVTVTVSSVGKSATAEVQITVASWRPPSVQITAGSQTKFNNNEKIALQGAVVAQDSDFSTYWSWPDGEGCAYLVPGC